MSENLRRAAAYVRTATPDNVGIATQLRKCREAAASDGFVIDDVHVFADCGVSALAPSRPAWDRLLSATAEDRPEFTRLYVLDLTRFGRWTDPRMSSSFEALFELRGVKVRFCNFDLALGNQCNVETHMT